MPKSEPSLGQQETHQDVHLMAGYNSDLWLLDRKEGSWQKVVLGDKGSFI